MKRALAIVTLGGVAAALVDTGLPDDEPEYEFGSVSLTWALIVARLKDVVEAGGEPNPALS